MRRAAEAGRPLRRLAGIERLVFVLLAAVVLASCGGSANDAGGGDSADGDQAAGKKAKVAYIDGSCTNSWRIHARAEFEDAAEKHPQVGETKYVCAQGDLNQMIAGIQSSVSQGYDALVVFSDFGDAILPAVRDAHAKGVEVVPWLVEIGGTPGEDYTAYVEDDPQTLGTRVADYFIEKLGGEGNIVGVAGPEGNSLDAGIEAAAKKRLAEKAPKMRWLETAWADWDPAKSVQAASAMLSKYPKIDGLWSIEGSVVPGILQRWQAAGRDLPVIRTNDQQELMDLYAKLKEDNPTLEYGFESARAYGSRQALEVAMQAYADEQIDESLLTIENDSWDCATDCERFSVPDMPGSYVPTSKVSPEKLRPLLEGS